MRNFGKTRKRLKIGPVAQKVLLLLSAGLALSLTARPDYYFRVIESATKEWRKINQRSLREAIRRLYQSKMIDIKENKNDTATLILSDQGKKRALTFSIDRLKIQKLKTWDGLWRIVAFDIPENKKKVRNAFSLKLKNIGMLPLQDSVFISPYECRDEIEFIVEIFEIKSCVRFIMAKDIDIALDLKKRFELID